MKRNIFFLWCFIFFLAFNANAQNSPGTSPNILHMPVIGANISSDLIIDARVTDPDGDLKQVLLYYRIGQEGAFNVLDMMQDGEVFRERILAEEVTREGIDYYIEAIDKAGNIATYPFANPRENPLHIKGVQSTAITREPEITILSPEPQEVVQPANVMIAASFYDPQGDIDLSTVQLQFNGVDITKDANINSGILTYVFTETLNKGLHKIEIQVRDLDGNEAREKWYFNVSERIYEKELIKVKGNIGVSSKYNNISGDGKDRRNEPEWENNLNFTIKGETRWFGFDGRLYLTSNEESDVQPRNRYQFGIYNPYVSVKVGDVNPDFTAFTIDRQRVRGVETKLMLNQLKLHFFQGEAVRSIQKEGITSREVRGMRAAISAAEGKFLLGASYVKAKDDTASINLQEAKQDSVLRSPKENVVASTDLNLNFGSGFLVFTSEVAVSALTQDLTSREVGDEFPNWMENSVGDLITVNASTLEPSEHSMAARIVVKNNYKFNQLELGFRSIGPSYRSIVNSTLQSDQRGFKVSDRLRLMRNRLIFGITFDAYEDNLAENKLTTTTTNSISSNLNYRHSFKYPSLSLGIKNFSRKGEDTEIVDNNTFTLSVGSNYSFLLGQTRNVLNVNFVNTNHADNVYPTADFDNFSFLFGSTSIFDNLPMTISMGVGYNQNKGEIVTTSFNTFSLRGSYQFLDSKLIAKLGTNMINGSRDDDKLASTKLRVETGADYRWTKERILGMSLGFVNYSDSENPNTEYNEAILRFYASQRF